MIKQAVVLAAGMGSRFAPITKVIPKPMLPIGNRPTLDYVIKELRDSGIERIIIVVGHKREIIQEYYEKDSDISFVVQNVLNGTAPALGLAESYLANAPFALCYSDEILDCSIPCIKQLINVFMEKKAEMVTGVEEVDDSKIKAYNSLSHEKFENGITKINSIIEKPKGAYPSNVTSIGRYILSPIIFKVIKELKQVSGKEIVLTEAFNLLSKRNAVYGLAFKGKRWDIGTKEGWIETNVGIGMK